MAAVRLFVNSYCWLQIKINRTKISKPSYIFLKENGKILSESLL